jgi:hypothetical protein
MRPHLITDVRCQDVFDIDMVKFGLSANAAPLTRSGPPLSPFDLEGLRP